MSTNKVKKILGYGGVVIGSVVRELELSQSIKNAAAAGADFVICELEQANQNIACVRNLVSLANTVDVLAIFRVPATRPPLLFQPLEGIAMGWMLPHVKTEREARTILRCVKFAPDDHGAATIGTAPSHFGPEDASARLLESNAELLLVAPIETAEGVENVERIATLDGIDVIWFSHSALGSSTGIPGEWTRSMNMQALEHVVDVSKRCNKAAGFMAMDLTEGTAMLARGFRCIAFSADTVSHGAGLRQVVAALRATLEATDLSGREVPM